MLEIIGEKIRIRANSLELATAHAEAARESFPHLKTWMSWCRADYQVSDSQSWMQFSLAAWARGDEFNFAVLEKNSERFLGAVGLNKLDKEFRCANLGYWTRTSELGKGIAGEAALLLAQHALTALGFNRLEILTADKNFPSQRVAEKAGAQREGIARKRLLLCGVAHDAVVFSLIRDDLGHAK